MKSNSRLKAIRKSLGFTQELFSFKLDVSHQAYMNYENGKRNIPEPVLIKLQQLGFSIDWILTGSGEMHLIKVSTKQYAIVDIPPGLTKEDIEIYLRARAQNESILKEKTILDQKIICIEQALSKLDAEDRDRILNAFLQILLPIKPAHN